MPKIIQFNWRRHWSKKVAPYLDDQGVKLCLLCGMRAYDPLWDHDWGPHLIGAIGCGRIVTGKLSWYQPLCRCHWIAPFSWAIGKKVYPDLKWGFLTSDKHTVAVGLDGEDIKVVMDILLFDHMTAEESIDHVGPEGKIVWDIKEIFVKG